MQSIILGVHILVSICLIILVLLQHGKGASAGAAGFGMGSAANTMFGSVGNTSFLMKCSIVLATIFIMTSLGLSRMVLYQQRSAQLSAMPVVPKNKNASSVKKVLIPSQSVSQPEKQPKQKNNN